ncbi:MAG: HAD family hydrolase [Shewanella sp.]|nr:HAD family hydrolase [Shewanella sp.]
MKKNNPIKGVLFDLDGTLADTAIDLIGSLNASLNEFGYDSCDPIIARSSASHGSLYMVQTALPNLSVVEQKHIQSGLLVHYQRLNGENGGLFEGMSELLSQLKQLNIPFGVVTNKPARFCRPLITKLGLLSDIGCIVSGDSTSFPKPHSAPMLLAAQQINCLPADILYIGDAQRDIEAAKNSGMRSVAALWGYIAHNDEPESWGADHSLKTPIDLLQLFKMQN